MDITSQSNCRVIAPRYHVEWKSCGPRFNHLILSVRADSALEIQDVAKPLSNPYDRLLAAILTSCTESIKGLSFNGKLMVRRMNMQQSFLDEAHLRSHAGSWRHDSKQA